MAQHSNPEDFLTEVLTEYIFTAKMCLDFKKGDDWSVGKGDVIVFPTAALLFMIVDAIGSWFRGNKNFKIVIDGENRNIINSGFHHFYIFNSEYYNLDLTEKQIKIIYDNYRCLLLHNAVLPPRNFINSERLDRKPFDNLIIEGKETYGVFLIPFYNKTVNALKKFIKEIDNVVPSSDQRKILDLKAIMKSD
jgi:hypothetical protein